MRYVSGGRAGTSGGGGEEVYFVHSYYAPITEREREVGPDEDDLRGAGVHQLRAAGERGARRSFTPRRAAPRG